MRILIVSGGTGGHISPGLSIYNRLKEEQHSILFVTNPHALKFPLIKDNIPSSQVEVIPISSGFTRNLLKNLVVIKDTILSFLKSLKIILNFKPDRIVLTGGYVSGPVGLAGAILRKPIILLEQNAVMGLTNRIISLFAKKVILTFPLINRRNYPNNFERIGNPIRYSERDIQLKDYAKNTFGFSSDDKVVGIILGSQGAKNVNKIISENIYELTKEYKVIWITGQDYYKEILEKCKDNSNVKIFDFISDVSSFMSAIDVAITRGGASTISELSFFGVPSLIIPFPYASKNHQYHNAMFVESRGAGIVIEEKDLTISKILEAVNLLFKNYDIFKSNAKKLFPKNTTDRVIQQMLD